MLTEKRIREAEINVRSYLQEGLLKKTTDTDALYIFVKNAKDSLRAAKLLHENNIDLWTIVSSYYSMFYIANAVLIKKGYKTGEKIVHRVTADALITIIRTKLKEKLIEEFEESQEEAMKVAGIKTDEMIESFDFERRKRSFIQYDTPDSDIMTKAKTSLQRSQEFLFEMEKLLK